MPLSGTAVAQTAALTVTPSSLTFSNQTVGTASASQGVTLKNTGTGAVTILQVGTVPSVFAQVSPGATKISPGGQVKVAINFTPNAPGVVNGT